MLQLIKAYPFTIPHNLQLLRHAWLWNITLSPVMFNEISFGQLSELHRAINPTRVKMIEWSHLNLSHAWCWAHIFEECGLAMLSSKGKDELVNLQPPNLGTSKTCLANNCQMLGGCITNCHSKMATLILKGCIDSIWHSNLHQKYCSILVVYKNSTIVWLHTKKNHHVQIIQIKRECFMTVPTHFIRQ